MMIHLQKKLNKGGLSMGDYDRGVASPETMFLILILLMTGTFGRGRKRPYDES